MDSGVLTFQLESQSRTSHFVKSSKGKEIGTWSWKKKKEVRVRCAQRACKRSHFSVSKHRGIRGEGKWRENRGRTPRLEPWHPEGQTTCRAKPLGIDTAPYMINRAVTCDKCSTVYVTYFKMEEAQHYFCSSFPLYM